MINFAPSLVLKYLSFRSSWKGTGAEGRNTCSQVSTGEAGGQGDGRSPREELGFPPEIFATCLDEGWA